MAGDPPPLYELLFDINYQLCKTYPALSPFEVDARSYHEIIILYAETKRAAIREKKEVDRAKSGVIRKPAGDDWF